MINYFKNIFKKSKNLNEQEEQISAVKLKYLMDNSKIKVIPLDVRSQVEYERYHIKGAINLHIEDLSVEKLLKILNLKKNEKVIVVTYCNAGGRGGRSFTILKQQNTNPNLQLKNLTHGINEWINKGFEIEEGL